MKSFTTDLRTAVRRHEHGITSAWLKMARPVLAATGARGIGVPVCPGQAALAAEWLQSAGQTGSGRHHDHLGPKRHGQRWRARRSHQDGVPSPADHAAD